jgi:hypothetical protein
MIAIIFLSDTHRDVQKVFGHCNVLHCIFSRILWVHELNTKLNFERQKTQYNVNDSTEHLIFFKTNSLSWYTSIVIGIVEMLLLVFSLHA